MMLKKIFAALLVAVTAGNLAIAQSGTLKGKAIDETNGEGISFANVQIEQNGNAVARAVADINGEFTIKPIPPGTYDVKVASVGYQTYFTKGVVIGGDKTSYVDAKVKSTAIETETVVIVDFVEPLIDPDTKSGGTVTRAEFQAMASKNINSVASTTAGVFQADEGKDLNVRGAREGGNEYYIDGQKVRGTTGLPQSSIEQVSVITGGIPAQYGDATGGIISITTRSGMTNNFYGGVELVSSQLTDAYDYNFADFNVGGPLFSKKDSSGGKQAKIGFFLAASVASEKDPNPSAVGIYKIKDDKLKELQEKPISVSEAGTAQLNGEFLKLEDLEKVKAKQNIPAKSVRLSGKLDFKVANSAKLTLGGSMDYANNRIFSYVNSLLSADNNLQDLLNTINVYGRFTHELGKKSSEDKSTSLIQNAYYTLQFGYNKVTQTRQHAIHKDNFFNYGYVGKFERKRANTYEAVTDSAGNILYYDQNGVGIDTQVVFTPGTQNEFASNYTSQFYELFPGEPDNLNDIEKGYGLLNGANPRSVYGIWNNTSNNHNTALNPLLNVDNTQMRGTAQFSADIKNHAIQVGFEYEKRNDKSWSMNPTGATNLWSQMRLLTNKQLSQLDMSKYNPVTGNILVGTTVVSATNAHEHPFLLNANTLAAQSQFDKSLRERLGKGTGEWIDIDSYDPSTFSLDMFSADELLNEGNSFVFNYYGYSYDGKKTSGNSAFDMTALKNFYEGTDGKGNKSRVIPSFQPVYMAGFIQDKFDIKDMKFNIGLRIDHFNANQPVLKDKYLFNEAKTKGEVEKIGTTSINHPTNVSSSAIVYVDNELNPTKVLGYRDGDTWYNAQGTQVYDPKIISNAAGDIQPYLKNPGEQFLQKSKIENVFEMYKPQNTFMPRVAFSFPISDRANFFAHYDVLTQRPPTNLRFDPTDYLFIEQAGTAGFHVNNPNLKPERTIDYELGFSQVLNERKNASVTLSAFYREMRDMIQQINLIGAYPITYGTYGNIDFGNVKGFSVSYDLRRTNNVQINASYTLQFAEGTGSAANSANELLQGNQPNLRTSMPLDFDQRHAIVLTTDYRFGQGSDYKGPQAKWAKVILENLGGNLVFRAGSGLPYSRQRNVTSGNGDNTSLVITNMNQRTSLKGRINGSNLPWQYRADLRVDKNIPLVWSKEDGENKGSSSNLNIYVVVMNLFNTKNVINLYRYTGDPDDDGYLSAPQNALGISNKLDPQSFTDMYASKIANPAHYSIPRRVRIGLVLDF